MRTTILWVLALSTTGCKAKGGDTAGAEPDVVNACTLSENYCVGFGSGWAAEDAAAWCEEAGGTQDTTSCPDEPQATCDVEDEAMLTYHFYDTPPMDAKGYCSYLGGVLVVPEA